MRILIGLHGRKQAGKDTAADHLVVHHGFMKVAFADVLKSEVLVAWRLTDTPEILIQPTTKELPMRALALRLCKNTKFINWWLASKGCELEVAQDWKMPRMATLDTARSPRWIMQRWGDFMNMEHPGHYVERMRTRLNIELSQNDVVISDVRMPNHGGLPQEAMLVRHSGGQVIQIMRESQNTWMQHDTHNTELALPTEYIDTVWKNFGPFRNLFGQADDYVRGMRQNDKQTA